MAGFAGFPEPFLLVKHKEAPAAHRRCKATAFPPPSIYALAKC